MNWDDMVLFLILGVIAGLLLLGTPARSEPAQPATCQSTLSLCDKLVHSQATQIGHLKEDVATWKKQAENPVSGPSILLTSVAAGTLGGAAAAEVGGVPRGLVVGGLVGALAGLVIGLIVQ